MINNQKNLQVVNSTSTGSLVSTVSPTFPSEVIEILQTTFDSRPVNSWVTGVTLASVTVSFGVTGYSLPWDQIGYWACKIVTGVPAAVPVIGDTVVELLRGGTSVGQGTLTRFYSLHTFVLPLITAVLMLAHFLMIRKQGISGPL